MRTWMAWTASLVIVALGGCGPVVATSSSEGLSDSDGTDGDTEDPRGSTSSASDTFATTTASGPMSTSGPAPTGGPGGFDVPHQGSSSGGDATCAELRGLFTREPDARMLVRDHDSDGIEELWLAYEVDVGLGNQTQLYVIEDEQPAFVGGFPGAFIDLQDVDGDGMLDAVGYNAFFREPATGMFAPGPAFDAAQPTTLSLQTGFDGYAQASDDNFVDFFRITEDGLWLDEGDGGGTFDPGSGGVTVPAFEGPVSVLLVDGHPGNQVVLSESAVRDPLEGCVPHRVQAVDIAFGDLLLHDAAAVPPEYPLSAPMYALFNDGRTTTFNRACVEDDTQVVVVGTTFENRQHVDTNVYGPGLFVSVGDYDGDGHQDIAVATDDAAFVRVHHGTGDGSTSEPIDFPVDLPDVLPSQVVSVDLDGDGRDEIVVGSRQDTGLLQMSALDFDAC